MSTERGAISKIWNWRITALCAVILLVVAIAAVSFGPISINFFKVFKTLFDLPGGSVGQDRTVILQLRLPRVILGVLVGAALATSGAVYQTVFHNPLADPYLLGAASGAGLGATIALTSTNHNLYGALPIFAFLGGVLAVFTSFIISGKFFADPNSSLRDCGWIIRYCDSNLLTATAQCSTAAGLLLDSGRSNQFKLERCCLVILLHCNRPDYSLQCRETT
jgi:ABC-type Fe3+-siderophore transport system permease subunit